MFFKSANIWIDFMLGVKIVQESVISCWWDCWLPFFIWFLFLQDIFSLLQWLLIVPIVPIAWWRTKKFWRFRRWNTSWIICHTYLVNSSVPEIGLRQPRPGEARHHAQEIGLSQLSLLRRATNTPSLTRCLSFIFRSLAFLNPSKIHNHVPITLVTSNDFLLPRNDPKYSNQNLEFIIHSRNVKIRVEELRSQI